MHSACPATKIDWYLSLFQHPELQFARLWDNVGSLYSATRPATSFRNCQLHRRHTNMDGMRESFSKLKKDTKNRITGKKRKADKAQAGGSEKRVNVSGSLPQPMPHVVTSGGRGQRENESDWKSTASSSAKLLLRGVRDSADAFGPLKSVAGGLCFILENCEVRLPPHLLSTTLISPAAHEGEQTKNRIVGP